MSDQDNWRNAIASELARLNSGLKISTAEAIIHAKIFGESWDTKDFWKKADTCARSTYTKWRRYDPVFTDVMTRAWNIAKEYRSQEAATAITTAMTSLKLFSPRAAERITEIVEDDDPAVALRASTAVLDRADSATAGKAGIEVAIPGLDEALEKIYGEEQDLDPEGENQE